MLYLRLKQRLRTERLAFDACYMFQGFSPLVSPRKFRGEDGNTAQQFAVLIPAGHRPASIIKQLQTIQPHIEWELVNVDSEGFESPVEVGAP